MHTRVFAVCIDILKQGACVQESSHGVCMKLPYISPPSGHALAPHSPPASGRQVHSSRVAFGGERQPCPTCTNGADRSQVTPSGSSEHGPMGLVGSAARIGSQNPALLAPPSHELALHPGHRLCKMLGLLMLMEQLVVDLAQLEVSWEAGALRIALQH
ncbi:16 kDa beta-galactoside-binding lectin-like [Platysternon megacephalum]|uniref:16 kDa beta-galactoside-binding lectin-like n=1 Tax=Platysternon megacephalum TaxID=55544 RepID=A0A4D9DLB3_9SAUR|nr:16 kDa beta-galactoside-binding lectin-like [Platysternon megacephalum]